MRWASVMEPFVASPSGLRSYCAASSLSPSMASLVGQSLHDASPSHREPVEPVSMRKSRSRCDMVREATLVWRALGESAANRAVSRAMAWGPHEVGGAQPRAERLST